MDEGEFDYELEDAGNDLFSGNHSRREALFLPFSESGREAKEKSRETSTLSGKGGTEKLLKRSQETQLKVNGERTPAPWKDLKLFGHS